VINVPVTKNGPKGTSLFRVFFLAKISPIPIIAPIKKDKNKAIKILGKPKKSPIKKASFISPIPIQRPFEISTINKKNVAAAKAEINGLKIRNSKFEIRNKSQILNAKTIKIAG